MSDVGLEPGALSCTTGVNRENGSSDVSGLDAQEKLNRVRDIFRLDKAPQGASLCNPVPIFVPKASCKVCRYEARRDRVYGNPNASHLPCQGARESQH